MKRNLDLIRHILLTTESSERPNLYAEDYVTELFHKEQVLFHIELLLDCGYITATPIPCIGQSYPEYIVQRITSFGYDYLDNIRSDSIWKTTKEKLMSIGGSASLDVVKAVAGSIAMKFLGL